MAEVGRVHAGCPDASNPYHKCADYCIYKIIGANRTQKKPKHLGTIFGRRKKGTESFPDPMYSNDNFQLLKKKVEELNADHISSPQSLCEKTTSADSLFNESPHPSSLLVTPSKNFKPEHPKESSKNSTTPPPDDRLNIQDEHVKIHGLPASCSSEIFEDTRGKKGPDGEYKSFSSLEVVEDKEVTDEQEGGSILLNSDLRVWVGKYHVKASISSILKFIFDKYGDIAASCPLESPALRTYYLECLSVVVQELQSTPVKYLSKSKLKEMLAILRDVESAQINVSWLPHLRDQISEALELGGRHSVAEVTKANCERDLEKTKKKLESEIEDLNRKEKDVADAKARVEETKAGLNELEHKLSQLRETMPSLMSKIEKIECKTLLDQHLS